MKHVFLGAIAASLLTWSASSAFAQEPSMSPQCLRCQEQVAQCINTCGHLGGGACFTRCAEAYFNCARANHCPVPSSRP
jgi:hypothetical protein